MIILVNMRKRKIGRLAFVITGLYFIVACQATKKNAVSTAPLASTPKTTTTRPGNSPGSLVLTPHPSGTQAPGNEELNAIQVQYKEVSMEQLQAGHRIYTGGPCINCHGPISIYKIGLDQWKDIMDDMAQRAKLSEAQKDAVYKYVLSIKATEPK